MNEQEKIEILKATVEKLYSKEGKSKKYIAELLDVHKSVLSKKIKEWNLTEAEPRRHLKPSNLKFLNANRLLIKSRLDSNHSVKQIAEELNITRKVLFDTFIKNDDILLMAYQQYKLRNTNDKKELKRYIPVNEISGEIWKPILGYEEYHISNLGRIKRCTKNQTKWCLVSTYPNKESKRIYVPLSHANTVKNFNLARLVAHAFVDGFSEAKNTVNHIDGNINNNQANNLEWTSQKENNIHSYRVLNRQKVNFKKYHFSKILYKGKYEFKTIAALSRFIGKSPTQTRRYLDNPQKYEIELVR